MTAEPLVRACGPAWGSSPPPVEPSRPISSTLPDQVPSTTTATTVHLETSIKSPRPPRGHILRALATQRAATMLPWAGTPKLAYCWSLVAPLGQPPTAAAGNVDATRPPMQVDGQAIGGRSPGLRSSFVQPALTTSARRATSEKEMDNAPPMDLGPNMGQLRFSCALTKGLSALAAHQVARVTQLRTRASPSCSRLPIMPPSEGAPIAVTMPRFEGRAMASDSPAEAHSAPPLSPQSLVPQGMQPLAHPAETMSPYIAMNSHAVAMATSPKMMPP